MFSASKGNKYLKISWFQFSPYLKNKTTTSLIVRWTTYTTAVSVPKDLLSNEFSLNPFLLVIICKVQWKTS